MQYLAWADIQIPLCFVTGFSYTKRARAIEHAGGFVSSRGFETSEISVRVNLSRSTAMAFGLDYASELDNLENLTANRDNGYGTVSLGGYPIYPELEFALTNINKTYMTDKASNDIHTLEADITLSGVACVKEVSRERALIFDLDETVIELPKITIECQGKSLVVQDSLTVSTFKTGPASLDLEILIGQDDQSPQRAGFLNTLLKNFATVTCDLPQGSVKYNVIKCNQVDNALSITGSFFPESSDQAVTRSFVDCDLSDIIKALCEMMDIPCEVRISGQVDYYMMKCPPLKALEDLQSAAGFIVSRQGNTLFFVWIPDSLDPTDLFDLSITDDSKNELTCGILWRDGVNECFVGEHEGNVTEIDSVFRSSHCESFARQRMKYQRYYQTYVRIDDVIEPTIGAHSQIAIQKGQDRIAVLVDYAVYNWIDGTMMLECREVV